MPFHIHGSQMNGFPLPSSFHLSLLPSFPFCPPPSPLCSSQLPSITVTGRPQHQGRLCGWMGGWGVEEEGAEGKCVLWMWWEEETVADIPAHGICLQVCYMCACVCVCACAAVCLCDMPMWQSLATRRCCCSNDAVATTVWHLWRINIFHLDESYYPPLVVVEIQKKKLSSCSDCSAMFHLQHFTVKIRQTAFC